MITDEELAQLPEDPELAFVEFEKIMRTRLNEAEKEGAQNEYFDPNPYRREYMNRVLAAAKVYGIDALTKFQIPAAEDNFFAVYLNFQTDVDHITTQIRILNAPRNRQNSVGLDGNTKSKIHHHINQIRAAIETADLPDEKRDALYAKLDRFALEVDKTRTNLQTGMAVYISICDGIGQGFKKLEPARKWVDSIATLLGRAKEVEDSLQPKLPSPAERKKLEGPRKQLSGPEKKGSDLDDEIPF